jgi:hypothetical protein
LVATALLGSVLAAAGDRLVAAFHTAMMAAVIACIAASLSAVVLLEHKAVGPSKT